MFKKKYIIIGIILILTMSMATFCVNDKNNRPEISVEEIKNSDFYNIYTKILNPSCGKAGCHDGGPIEPDYTTLSSTYYTLVWHPATKIDKEKTIIYRVAPYDHKHSVLYERITNCCFVDKNDRMPFHDPDGLPQEDIDLIAKWIDEGAKDAFGHEMSAPQALIELRTMDIKYVDKNGEIRNDLTYKTNRLQEKYTRAIPTDAQKVYIDIDIKDIDLHKFKLQLFADAEYQKKLSHLKPIKLPDEKTIRFEINKKYLKNNHLVFFRLFDDTNKAYSYPNTQMVSIARFDWSFDWNV